VQVAGSRPEEMQRRMARSSAFLGGVWPRDSLGGLRPAGVALVVGLWVGLGVGLRDVGVVDFLLLLFARFGRGKLLRSRLFARREELFQCAAGLIGVGHDAVAGGAIGMAHHAGGGVGEIAYVAAIDEDAFAVAYIGHVQLDVLRGGADAEQHGDAQLHVESDVLTVVPTVCPHTSPFDELNTLDATDAGTCNHA